MQCQRIGQRTLHFGGIGTTDTMGSGFLISGWGQTENRKCAVSGGGKMLLGQFVGLQSSIKGCYQKQTKGAAYCTPLTKPQTKHPLDPPFLPALLSHDSVWQSEPLDKWGGGSIENVWLGFNPLSGSGPHLSRGSYYHTDMALWLCITFCVSLKMRGLSTLHVAKPVPVLLFYIYISSFGTCLL